MTKRIYIDVGQCLFERQAIVRSFSRSLVLFLSLNLSLDSKERERRSDGHINRAALLLDRQ